MSVPTIAAHRPTPAPSFRWALAALSLSILLSSLGTSSANVGLPAMAEAFGASFQAVQWIVLAYLLAVTTLVVSVGRLGDMIGRRRLLLAGIGLFTAASVLCAAAPSLPLLVAARAAQGLGAAAMMALGMALVGQLAPKAGVGSAMGLVGTMSAVGTALGPSLGGALIAGFGWRAIFAINAPLGVAAFLLALRHLPRDGEAGSARAAFDVRGTVLFTLTLTAYALAMTIGRGAFGPANAALLLATALGAGLFVRSQGRAASPLIQPAMFRDPVIGTGLAASALVSTVMMATLVVGPFYLARALGHSAAAVGAAMSVGPLVAALVGVPAGRLVDLLGARRMTIVGLAGIGLGAAALAVMPMGFGVAGFIAAIVVVTAHYGLFQAANNTAAMTGVGSDRRGAVSGLLNLSRNLGLITGASVMGAVFAFAARADDLAAADPQAIAGGMRFTFAAAAGLIGVAMALVASRRARD